ncbi:general transcription factor 3C polypeptide 5 isoform X2 [Morus notabilis]|uniref:general transcription factor 3C polypeptide 5 isoform X2 n=1 Tax=Morus notabilis TaxID=981085 RepID=UPI000CED57E8|nr:general transcription factor 3C polypeptide 5 isoform X2 [Morus notabilis]
MGVIKKDGRVSGFVPSKEAFAVNYPGYPSSISRAVETLGGLEAIHKARSLQSNRLELHFRPEDPYSHPAFGDLRPCNHLLLKLSRIKSSNGQDAQVSGPSALQNGNNLDYTYTTRASGSTSSAKQVDVQIPEDDQTNFCADIVARVLEAYHFDGMVDYQHVTAVHADVARRKKRKWLELEEPLSEKNGLMDVDEDDVMMLVPPLFAPKDFPENLVLRPSVILSSKKNEEAINHPDLEIDMELVLAIDFNIIEIPKRIINWEQYIPKGSYQWELQMAVSKLFDERPIWIKHSVNERLVDKGYNVVDHMLRRLLSRVAYYFSSGPFLRFWIKKGYDPRKDPDSRIYQRIDFRVHPSLRSYCDANVTNQGKKEKQRWGDICTFQVFPVKCQTSLQLFELADDYIQQEIRKPPSQKTCTPGTGWFSSTVHDSLRHRISIRFLSTYPKPGAEHLLKEATENFEKSKRRLSKDCVMLHEEERQEVDSGNEDVQEPNIVEDEEEEEEIDEEADDEISLQSHPYLNMESVSRTHLQELFGSFPSTEAGGDKIQNADTSDEEYQIFEQDSDGNFSDEHDY